MHPQIIKLLILNSNKQTNNSCSGGHLTNYIKITTELKVILVI